MSQRDDKDQEPPQQRQQDWRLRLIGWFVVGAGFALGAVIPEPPQTLRGWLLVVAGSLGAVLLFELSRVKKWPEWLERRLRRHLKIVVTLGLALLVALGIGFAASQLLRGPIEHAQIWLSGCPQQTELRLLTSSDGLGTARMLADEYEQWTANGNHGCPTVQVHAYTAASAGTTLDALKAGWSSEYLRDVGPRPDLWLAEWGAEFDALATMLTASNAGEIRILEQRSVASSPLVLGVTETLVKEASYSKRKELTWTDLLQEYPEVVRPDPSTAPMGQVATAVLYGFGTENPVNVARAREIELQIGRSLDEGQYILSGGRELLCQHRLRTTTPSTASRAARTAVIVSEQALMQFNAGAPLDGKCPEDFPAVDALLAFYPPETRALDYRIVRFTSYPDQENESDSFTQWLATDEGKNVLVDAGLRPPDFPVREPLSELNGLIPGAIHDPAHPAALSSAMKLYQDANRPGRVLLALDSSGSMNNLVGAGQNRFDIASEGVQHALQLMGPEDELGLRLFPEGEAVHLGPRDRAGEAQLSDAITAALNHTAPGGNTPLFRAIVHGVSEVESNREVGHALVVLTDGEDTAGDFTLEQVRAAVEGKNVRIFVIAIGEAGCASEALQALTADTGGACQNANFSSVKYRMADVFGALWG